MTTTYLGSGDASRHRRDYRPEWLENLADDVTMEGCTSPARVTRSTSSSRNAADALHKIGAVIPGPREIPMVAG